MRPRRTAIVPNMIWGTAIASIVPSQLVACGGTTVEQGSGGSGGQSSAGHSGRSAGEGGKIQGYAGYIVLAIGAFGPDFAGAPGSGAGGSDVMIAGAGGSGAGTGGSAAGAGGSAAGAGGSAGKSSTAGHAGFIVLAAAAFGGKGQQ